MENITTWLVEVVYKKAAPAAMASLLSAGVALAAAHQGLLEAWGITVGQWPLPISPAPSGMVMLIEFDTISSKLIALGAMGLVGLVAIGQHHAAAVVTGKPQSGDMRAVPLDPVPGGKRETDPPVKS